MLNSELIANSNKCHSKAKLLWACDPDELFNTCWIKFREKEIADPSWSPSDPERYFIKMLNNEVIDWKRKKENINIESVNTPYQKESSVSLSDQLSDWVESPPIDPTDKFLKNVAFLALRCNSKAHKVAGMSRSSFWKYKRMAMNKFYEKNIKQC